MRLVHTVAARPCVVDPRRDRWDDAASAVTPELDQPLCRRATRVMTTAAAIIESRRAESVVVAGRREVGRAERGDRRDGAASAVPEPVRAIRRHAARAVTAEAATTESRRAESVAAGRRSDVGRPPGRGVRRARAVAVRP